MITNRTFDYGNPTRMRHLLASISQCLRLPTSCALCHQTHREAGAICSACRSLFVPIGPACRYCALPLPESSFMVCGYCSKKKPNLDHTLAACHFVEPLRTLLHEFKYHEGLYLSATLSQLILDVLPEGMDKPQCLLPVPIHPKRLRIRGFNQAAELTKQLARTLKLPYNVSLCKKIINTPPQASLNAAQRRKNLQNAFTAAPLPFQHIALIDDLVTTGSTANELAKVLKQQGVTRVDLWCCARVVSCHAEKCN